MHVTQADFTARIPVATPSRVENFIRHTTFDRPTLVLDVDAVETQFHALKAGLGRADIHFAVKANPAREIIERLVSLGSHLTLHRVVKLNFACRSVRGRKTSLLATPSNAPRTLLSHITLA